MYQLTTSKSPTEGTVINSLKMALRQQYGAAIHMLQNAIENCPEEVWDNDTEFWYKTYHTLFCLDYYLDENPKEFHPPEPYTLSELDPNEVLPERTYSAMELLGYLSHCRKKCKARIKNLTEDALNERFNSDRKNYTTLEMLLYTLRHTQHHVGQLNMVLRQEKNRGLLWVSRKDD